MKIEKIGIIGAGQMGSGIAHVSGLGGFDVYLMDVDRQQLDNALAGIEKNLNRQVAKQKVGENDARKALGRIETGTEYDGFAACDIVIEAAS